MIVLFNINIYINTNIYINILLLQNLYNFQNYIKISIFLFRFRILFPIIFDKKFLIIEIMRFFHRADRYRIEKWLFFLLVYAI